MQIWGLLILFYTAPHNAVDWKGPWDAHKFYSFKEMFASEQECIDIGKEFIANIGKGMKAPARYRCIPFDQKLQKNSQG